RFHHAGRLSASMSSWWGSCCSTMAVWLHEHQVWPHAVSRVCRFVPTMSSQASLRGRSLVVMSSPSWWLWCWSGDETSRRLLARQGISRQSAKRFTRRRRCSLLPDPRTIREHVMRDLPAIQRTELIHHATTDAPAVDPHAALPAGHTSPPVI